MPLFYMAGGVKRRECIVGFGIEAKSTSEQLTIDWTRVTLLADNVAHPAAPGYAKAMTSSLQQRPSMAPPGTLLRETVWPADKAKEEACLARAEALIALDLPMMVGSQQVVARVTTNPTTIAIDEREAFKAMTAPSAVPPPDDFFPTTTVLAGVGAGVVCGGLAAAYPFAVQSENAALCAAGCGGPVAIAAAAVGAFLGWGVDAPALRRFEEDSKAAAVRRNYEEHRKKLGIDSPPK